MSHSPSLPILDYDELSSPDPLGTSFDNENVASQPKTSSPLKRGQLSSLSKLNHTTQEIRFEAPQSPSKTNLKTNISPSRTVSEQTLSPWKIRVTVEAEPEDMESGASTITKTVKIPLRQDSSPQNSEHREVRARNNTRGQSGKKRSGTPVRGRSGSRTRRQSVTDLNITVLGDDADGDEWTLKKSPRKRKTSQSQKKRASEPCGPSETDSDLSLSQKGGKKKQIESVFEIHEDAYVANETQEEHVIDTESPELRQIDLNRVSVRSRSWSTNQQDVAQTGPARTDENADHGLKPTQSNRKVSNISAASYPTPSPSSSYHGNSDEQDKSLVAVEEFENDFSVLESEGFTMIDLDSIPSARQLCSSPLGGQQQSQSRISSTRDQREEQPTTGPIAPKVMVVNPEPKPTLSYPTLPEGDSDISSAVPSSPPVISAEPQQALLYKNVDQTRKVTPLMDSSPRLPPIPRVARRNPPNQGHKHKLSAGVVSTGIALQHVISSESKGQNAQDTVLERQDATPRDEPDHLFDGFDSGTKRELRAGLRFGEELARKQISDDKTKSDIEIYPQAEVLKASQIYPAKTQNVTNFGTQIWRGETTVTRSPLVPALSNEKTTCNAIENDNFMRTKNLSYLTKSGVLNNDSLNTKIDDDMLENSAVPNLGQSMMSTRARRERQYEMQREAVSQEAENADPDNIVTIESDNEETDDAKEILGLSDNLPGGRASRIGNHRNEDSFQDDGNEDIWLAEAHNTSSSDRNQDEQDLFTSSEQRRQRERAREVVNKPRRTLIPSPWKRGEDLADSTILTEGDMSGMLWQQPQDKLKFGSGEIARQKKTLNGKFDIDRMVRPTLRSKNFNTSQLEYAETGDAVASSSDEDEGIAIENSGLSDPGLDNVEQPNKEDSLPKSRSFDLPVKIPVNFNDSSIATEVSDVVYTPPMELEQVPRPTTPRSAMKGARFSLGLENPDMLSPAKKVIFSKRYRCMDQEGVEESISANLSSPTSNHVDTIPQPETKVVEATEDLDTFPKQNTEPSGWLNWLWKTKQEDNTEQHEPKVPTISHAVDGANDHESKDQWHPTKASIPTSSAPESNSTKPTTNIKSKVPSYLRPPSYPSDPTRDPSIPLAISGDFTNTHFRTLHIIWRKSQRPKFHGPKSIRSSLTKLLGMKIVIDEHNAGLGSFEWQCGQPEIQVLERFMQEVEFGYQKEDQDPTKHVCVWGWDPEDLAKWLCRIVVGEIVRDEEGGKKLT